jgi:hypothetical protein
MFDYLQINLMLNLDQIILLFKFFKLDLVGLKKMIMCSSQTMKFELANFIGQTLDQKDFFMVEKGH